MRRPIVLASLLAAAGCGGTESGGFKLEIQPSNAAPSVSTYDVRVFGAKVSCDDALKEPAAHLTVRICGADGDTATDCHLARALVTPGSSSQIPNVSPGTRAVFVIGQDGQKANVVKGCGTAQVEAGKAASVSISTGPY